jgi:hypothetical protein
MRSSRSSSITRDFSSSGVHVEAAGEYAEAIQYRLLWLGQQFVRPVDQRAQRLLSLEQHAAAARQEPISILEPYIDVSDGKRPHSRGSELEREWNSLQPSNQFGHGGGLLFIERKSRSVKFRPLDKQPDRR